MTAAHERHPAVATNGACHGNASSSGQRGSASRWRSRHVTPDSTSPARAAQTGA
jgi:hypothetical protein